MNTVEKIVTSIAVGAFAAVVGKVIYDEVTFDPGPGFDDPDEGSGKSIATDYEGFSGVTPA